MDQWIYLYARNRCYGPFPDFLTAEQYAKLKGFTEYCLTTDPDHAKYGASESHMQQFHTPAPGEDHERG
jgi:hypothetical protein